MRFIIMILLFCIGVVSCVGTKQARMEQDEAGRSNAFEPYIPEASQAPPKKRDKNKRSFRSRYTQTLEDKKEEFQDRMEANTKRDRKMRRKMKKPQYSDPLYFGHKNKPKKREPGKRKFCKECGIVH